MPNVTPSHTYHTYPDNDVYSPLVDPFVDVDTAISDPPGHVDTAIAAIADVGVEQLYNEASKQKMLLVVFTIGLKASDGSEESLLNLEEEPWKSQAPRSVKPTAKKMKDEVVRRSKKQSIVPTPKPAYWPMNKLQEWLEKNPIVDDADVAFLRYETKRVTDIFTLAANDEEYVTNNVPIGANWVGNLPHLRLILCLTEDDCRAAFLRRNVAKTRTEIDEQNSSTRPPTAYELIADRWNSPDFNPTADPSDCHEDFREAIDCSYDKVKLLRSADPKRVQNFFTDYRTHLIRIIRKWEDSGQGEGGRSRSNEVDDGNLEEHFGALPERPVEALETRRNFLNGKPSYLLYFWEMADTLQVLQSSLSRIDAGSACASAQRVPSVVRRLNKSPTDFSSTIESSNIGHGLEKVAESQQLIAESQNNLAAVVREEGDLARKSTREEGDKTRLHTERLAKRQRLEALVDKQQVKEEQAMTARCNDNTTMAEFYDRQVVEIKTEINNLRSELNNTE